MTGKSDRTLLEHLGFELAGEWILQEGQPKIRYLSSRLRASQKVLYAFVSDNEVLYLGKTVNRLDLRLNGYVHPGPKQKTNQRVHALLKETLPKKPVHILALPGEGKIEYRGVPVNLAAGLEDELIARINPPWNLQGT